MSPLKIEIEDVLIGECIGCSARALVLKRDGLMVCPHCARPMEWTYQKPGDTVHGDPRLGEVLDAVLSRAVKRDTGL